MTEEATRKDSQSPESSRADTVALELMKQLITLASGVLALSATFIQRLGDTPLYVLILLGAAWFTLLVSVLFGLETISAIVKSRLEPEEFDWSTGYGRASARISKYGFVLGISLFAIFAFMTLTRFDGDRQNTGRVQINVNDGGAVR